MNKINKLIVAGMLLIFATFSSCSSEPKVTLTEDERTYTLSNGIISVMVSKESGDLLSLRYLTKEGIEMLGTFLTPEGLPDLEKDPPGANPNGINRNMTDHQYGFWSHDAMGVRDTRPATATVTIDPKKNGGKMAEVSIKGIGKGRRMGTGPGQNVAVGNLEVDVEIRYTLEQNSSGVYTYCIFTHPEDYGLAMFGEARFCAKLADFFDWMSIDEKQNRHFPIEYRLINKYTNTVTQSTNKAFGWSSTTKNVGLFLINPSMEYMSGGPTKVEFLGHRDTNPIGAPCALNYWRSSHYGGAEANIAAGESWNKIIGPFLIYANTGDGPQAIYENAKARAKQEADKWPYEWVNGVDYPKNKERGGVKGKLTLNDPTPPAQFTNLNVGLTAGEYISARPEGATPAIGAPLSANIKVIWQRDAKFYQFWTTGNADGSFEINNVRPGKYTLYAFTNGVLGEFQQANIVVEAGKQLDLGNIEWMPVRKGKQVWDIGIPNRKALEFYMGDKFNTLNISYELTKLYPNNDMTYTIGTSNFARDWFFQHVPFALTEPAAPRAPQPANSQEYYAQYGQQIEDVIARAGKPLPANPQGGPGARLGAGSQMPAAPVTKETPFTIVFDMNTASRGQATIRFAFCGTGVNRLGVSVNGKQMEGLVRIPTDGVISSSGSSGIWHEQEFVFDAALLKQGTNKIVLTVPAGPVNRGLMYDYIRLELDENATSPVS